MQLWRTQEVSDALLLVVDARTPLLSFPAPLYEAASARGTPMVVVLNKADLLPPPVVEAWVHHLRERFPHLAAVVPFRADPGAAPKGFKRGPRRTGWSRWRDGDAAVRGDVDALLRAVRALPVTRHNMHRTFADFWASEHGAGDGPAAPPARGAPVDSDAPSADASGASSGSDDEDDNGNGGGGARVTADEAAHAAAALARSEDWAAQQEQQAGNADTARTLLPYVTIGVVGEPNMGKSAVINRLFRAPVVKVRCLARSALHAARKRLSRAPRARTLRRPRPRPAARSTCKRCFCSRWCA